MISIELFRFHKRKYQDSAFTGIGAHLYGGRWNDKGLACVYTSHTISLAALEILVHVQDKMILDLFELHKIIIPDDDFIEHNPSLRNLSNRTYTREFGNKWLRSFESLALVVPSAVVPNEKNVLINPNHPDFKNRRNNTEILDFSFDSRLRS